MCVISHFSRAGFFVTLWTVSLQAPLSTGFSRQEYWSGLHVLLQVIFLTKGSNLSLLCLLHWQAGSLPLAPPGKPGNVLHSTLFTWAPNWVPMEHIVYIIRPAFTIFLQVSVLSSYCPPRTDDNDWRQRAILSSLHMINIDSAFHRNAWIE